MEQLEARVAILFADLTDSTQIYSGAAGNQAREMAARYVDGMMEETRRAGGTVIKTVGDGVMCTFPTSDAAFDAAAAIQRRMLDEPRSVKIGFHFGRVIQEGGDVFGDAVNLAARVWQRSTANETLLTADARERLDDSRTSQTRFFDTTVVKGKRDPVTLYKALIEDDTEVTISPETGVVLALQATQVRKAQLTLTYQGIPTVMQEGQPALVIGRDPTCSLVVPGPYASRRHLSIESRRESFILQDQSTNGTFVVIQGNAPQFLKRDTIPLLGEGRIGLGEEPDIYPEHAIAYAYTGPDTG